MKRLSISVLVFFVLANNSLSQIRRVPQVYSTIQSAIDSCSLGDTILVDKGSYIEQISINKPLTIVGTDKDSVIVSAQFAIKASSVRIQQLTISTFGHSDLPIQVIVDSSSDVRFSALYLTAPDAGNTGQEGGKNMTISSSSDISLTSVFMKAGRGGPGNASHTNFTPGGNGGYGIMISHSTNVAIDSSTIYGGNGGGGGYANPAGNGGDGIIITHSTQIAIDSSTIYGGDGPLAAEASPAGKNGNPLMLNDSSIVSLSNSKVKYQILVDSSSSISLTNDTTILTSVFHNDPSNNIPSKYQLGQNFPNPFNPSTSISFELPSQSVVLMKVCDITGRDVTTLVNQELPPGHYVCRWNATQFASGIYFYTMHASTFTETKKLVLLK